VREQVTKPVVAYTEFHPRWYRSSVPTYWWLEQWRYLKFILRELSSVFVAGFVVMTLLQLRALRAGPQAYARFQQWLQTPWVLILNAIALIFILFHTVTWFNLAPRALTIRLRGKRIPEVLIAAPNYALWLLISVAVGWLLLR